MILPAMRGDAHCFATSLDQLSRLFSVAFAIHNVISVSSFSFSSIISSQVTTSSA